LDRGYAIVQREGVVVRNAADLHASDLIGVRFARGTLTARVEQVATNVEPGANNADG
jgi:exonuclease VII large subunit